MWSLLSYSHQNENKKPDLKAHLNLELFEHEGEDITEKEQVELWYLRFLLPAPSLLYWVIFTPQKETGFAAP